MRSLLTILILMFVQKGLTQDLDSLNNRWAFTGLRTTVFKTDGSRLYIGMLEYLDTLNFSRFVRGESLDSSLFIEASVLDKEDTLTIEADFRNIQHQLKLWYLSGDPNHIFYTGDVYFDSSKVIMTNSNCRMAAPVCINRLYDRNELNRIMKLKTPESFSRDDAFEFLIRLNEKLKSACNRCYAGFTDAYMNEVLIQMGFNPITKKSASQSLLYNTSGFTSYLKIKFSSDQRLNKLIDFVFDAYLLPTSLNGSR